MVIAETSTHTAAIVSLRGRMTADRLGERLPARVARSLAQGHRTVIVDLEGVSYMDSSCLGEIVTAHAIADAHGGRLQLSRVPSRIRRLLDLAQLTPILIAA